MLLTLLFYVYKNLISLDNPRLIELLLQEEFHTATFGVLECITICSLHSVDDPDINISLFKYKFRSFITQEVIFHNYLELTDIELIRMIHLNYRLSFLKNTATARWVEETTSDLLSKVRE